MPNVTMLGVLVALRSRTHPDRQLFICIQQEYEEGPVTFQYLTQFEQEADAIIPVLPLFLTGVLGGKQRNGSNLQQKWVQKVMNSTVNSIE